MLSCHLAYFIALPDALVSWVPLIQLCMPHWRATCSTQLFIVTRLSGCSISIIKEQASVSLDLVPVSWRSASPSDYHGQDRALAQSSTILLVINRQQRSLASCFKSSKMSCFIYLNLPKFILEACLNSCVSDYMLGVKWCCSCFYQKAISSHPARAICVFSHGGEPISLSIFSLPLWMRGAETQEGKCLQSQRRRENILRFNGISWASTWHQDQSGGY